VDDHGANAANPRSGCGHTRGDATSAAGTYRAPVVIALCAGAGPARGHLSGRDEPHGAAPLNTARHATTAVSLEPSSTLSIVSRRGRRIRRFREKRSRVSSSAVWVGLSSLSVAGQLANSSFMCRPSGRSGHHRLLDEHAVEQLDALVLREHTELDHPQNFAGRERANRQVVDGGAHGPE
jgi:hypothetical protein